MICSEHFEPTLIVTQEIEQPCVDFNNVKQGLSLHSIHMYFPIKLQFSTPFRVKKMNRDSMATSSR